MNEAQKERCRLSAAHHVDYALRDLEFFDRVTVTELSSKITDLQRNLQMAKDLLQFKYIPNDE